MFENLERPICFVDIETTGLSIETDRIIEISIMKINVDGTRELKSKRFNPEMEISESATAVHGLTLADLENEKPFKKFAKGLHDFISGCDVAGFRSNNFDFPLLYNEFERCGVNWDWKSINMVDVGNIFLIKEPRTLGAALEFYTGKVHDNAHNSGADVEATVAVFEAQCKKYNLPKNINEIAFLSNYEKKNIDMTGKFYENADGEVVIGFGTHKGQLASSQESWLTWLTGDKANFSEEVKLIARKELNKIKKNKE